MFMSKVTSVASTCSAIAFISYHKVYAKELVECHDCHVKRLPKAKELPLYDKREDNFVVEFDEKSKNPFVSEISKIRKQVFNLMSYVDIFRKRAVNVYEVGVAHTQSSLEYFKSEENVVPRILIISSGGIAGYLFARKRGIFKKLLYPTIGTAALFAVFYPSVAKSYASSGFEFSKHHTKTLLEDYGGYDTNKMSEELNTKVEYLKSLMKFESLTKTLNSWFYRKKSGSKELSNGKDNSEEKNPGSPDADLYTTRSQA